MIEIPKSVIDKGVKALQKRSGLSPDEAKQFAGELAGDVRAVLEAVGYEPPDPDTRIESPGGPPWSTW